MIAKVELTPEELENVNGGVVVDRTFTTGYRVCDDATGALLCGAFTREDAQTLARKHGVSDEVITRSQFYDRYGLEALSKI